MTVLKRDFVWACWEMEETFFHGTFQYFKAEYIFHFKRVFREYIYKYKYIFESRYIGNINKLS